jgi:hypothetical protein
MRKLFIAGGGCILLILLFFCRDTTLVEVDNLVRERGSADSTITFYSRITEDESIKMVLSWIEDTVFVDSKDSVSVSSGDKFQIKSHSDWDIDSTDSSLNVPVPGYHLIPFDVGVDAYSLPIPIEPMFYCDCIVHPENSPPGTGLCLIRTLSNVRYCEETITCDACTGMLIHISSGGDTTLISNDGAIIVKANVVIN